jgi:hypothetical protein
MIVSENGGKIIKENVSNEEMKKYKRNYYAK